MTRSVWTNPLLNTPKFDLLTQDFSLAEKFFVSAPATRPSHTSYFTGLYPFEHGVYGQTYLKMFEGIPNLFQIFNDAGYHITGRSERPEVFRFLDFEPFITSVDPNAGAQHLGSLEKPNPAAQTTLGRAAVLFSAFLVYTWWVRHGRDSGRAESRIAC